jgi:hypothetical protein
MVARHIDVENIGDELPVPDALARQRALGAESGYRVDLVGEVSVALPDASMWADGNSASLAACTAIGFGKLAFEEDEPIRAAGNRVHLRWTRLTKQYLWNKHFKVELPWACKWQQHVSHPRAHDRITRVQDIYRSEEVHRERLR